jgi:beta-N-acetylhexosaminidase
MKYMYKAWAIYLIYLALMVFIFLGCSAGTPQDMGDGHKNVQNKPSPISDQDINEETTQDTQNNPPSQSVPPFEVQVKSYMAEMTLRQKIGQMIIVGFDGYEPSEGIKDMIRNYHVGNIVLFSRNVKDSAQLIELLNGLKALNRVNRIPLIISADQEGGRVTRLPSEATQFPSNLVLGNHGSYQLAYDVGLVTGVEMKAYGFNVNLAPVLDIFSNPNNTVIGDRALGKTPEVVSELGIALMKGLKDGGVIPVIKHFPGHGDTVVDSHVGLPSLQHHRERLEQFELVPFKEAIEHGAEMVMVAHIVFPQIAEEGLPASLSKEIITDILRQELGFEGVIISDDMDMGAIQKNYDMEEAAVQAVLAGTDIISICHDYGRQKKAFEALFQAVEDGTIPLERIDESVSRIIALKLKYGLTNEAVLDLDNVSQTVGTEQHRAIADRAWGYE